MWFGIYTVIREIEFRCAIIGQGNRLAKIYAKHLSMGMPNFNNVKEVLKSHLRSGLTLARRFERFSCEKKRKTLFRKKGPDFGPAAGPSKGSTWRASRDVARLRATYAIPAVETSRGRRGWPKGGGGRDSVRDVTSGRRNNPRNPEAARTPPRTPPTNISQTPSHPLSPPRRQP